MWTSYLSIEYIFKGVILIIKYLQVSSSAGSMRGAQSQGSAGSRNLNRMSTAPILGTSAITSPAGGNIFTGSVFCACSAKWLFTFSS
jgi:hypothetical protein